MSADAARAVRQQMLHEEMARGWRRRFLGDLLGPTPRQRYHEEAAVEYARVADCFANAEAKKIDRCHLAKEALDRFTALSAQFGPVGSPALYMARCGQRQES
jgi:hypothetical protein